MASRSTTATPTSLWSSKSFTTSGWPRRFSSSSCRRRYSATFQKQHNRRAKRPTLATASHCWCTAFKRDQVRPVGSIFNAPSRPLSSLFLFSCFHTNVTILTTNKCEKFPSSIWWWDSNPWPSDHESPPITPRPGLPVRSIFLHLKMSSREEQNEAWLHSSDFLL